jgi:hypothetical protein
MTEDGIEQGNEFLYNLGALTRKVNTIIPDNGSNGEETDNLPSTFWMTNPSNTWVGNVAAGSEDNGFWMELIKRGPREDMYPFDPKYEPLGRFENNVAHSNADVSSWMITVKLWADFSPICPPFLTERIQDIPFRLRTSLRSIFRWASLLPQLR